MRIFETHDPSRGAIREGILHAIANGERAWSSPCRIADAVRADIERTMDELAELELEGMIAAWERPEGIVVTLTPLAAERRGLRLIEVGVDRDPRWIDGSEPEPPAREPECCPGAVTIDRLSSMIDPRPAPDLAAEQSESDCARGERGTMSFRHGEITVRDLGRTNCSRRTGRCDPSTIGQDAAGLERAQIRCVRPSEDDPEAFGRSHGKSRATVQTPRRINEASRDGFDDPDGPVRSRRARSEIAPRIDDTQRRRAGARPRPID